MAVLATTPKSAAAIGAAVCHQSATSTREAVLSHQNILSVEVENNAATLRGASLLQSQPAWSRTAPAELVQTVGTLDGGGRKCQHERGSVRWAYSLHVATHTRTQTQTQTCTCTCTPCLDTLPSRSLSSVAFRVSHFADTTSSSKPMDLPN